MLCYVTWCNKPVCWYCVRLESLTYGNLTRTFPLVTSVGFNWPCSTSVGSLRLFRKGMLVQCAKQIVFCHVQTAVEEFHPFFTKEISFVPAFDCSEHTGPSTTVGVSCRTTLHYKFDFQTWKSNIKMSSNILHSVLDKSTRCSWVVTFISLVDYSTCFGGFLHPSSGV